MNAADLMPNDKLSRAILLERAKKLAEKIVTIENHDTVNFICFKLANNELYGVAYQNVEEVMDKNTLTKIPFAHPCVAGVTNYRGVLLTLIDLRKFFQLDISENPQKTYVIVTKIKGISIGILADDIEGIDEYDNEKMKNNIPYQGSLHSKYIVGIHNRTITILNIEAIITDLHGLLGKN